MRCDPIQWTANTCGELFLFSARTGELSNGIVRSISNLRNYTIWCMAKARRKSSHWMVFERITSGSWHFHSCSNWKLYGRTTVVSQTDKTFRMAFRCSQSSVAYAYLIVTATTMCRSGSLDARASRDFMNTTIFYCRRTTTMMLTMNTWTEPNDDNNRRRRKRKIVLFESHAQIYLFYFHSQEFRLCVPCAPSKSETCPIALHSCVICLWIFACETFSTKLSNRCYFCCAQQNEYIRKIINIVESSRVEVNRDLQLLLMYRPNRPRIHDARGFHRPPNVRLSKAKSECFASCGPIRRSADAQKTYGFEHKSSLHSPRDTSGKRK